MVRRLPSAIGRRFRNRARGKPGAFLRAAFARERLAFDAEALSRIEWILPDLPMAGELARALAAGYLRGADLWHIATALYVAPRAEEIGFITLDGPQRDVAAALGFQVGTGWPIVDSG